MRLAFTMSACLLLCACLVMGQVNTGELRLKVTDSTGAGLHASVTVLSQGNQYRTPLATDA